jgi:hypothetical protein
MHGGHFLPGHHNGVYFDLRNIHAQCYMCNVVLKGNHHKYFRFMQSKYGDEVIDELERLDTAHKSFIPTELQYLLFHYKELNKKL